MCYAAGMGGDLIREARRRAGLTQAQLAERAGTTQSAIARWETGKSAPSFDNVARLVRLCGFRLDIGMEDWAHSGIADDIHQAERNLRLDVEGRLRQLEGVSRLVAEGRRAVRAG